MAKQTNTVDFAGLLGARQYAADRLSSLANVKIGSPKGEGTITVSSSSGKIVISRGERSAENVSKGKTVRKK